MKTKIYAALFATFISVLFVGCGSDEKDSNPLIPGEPVGSVNNVAGKFEGWDLGEGMRIKFGSALGQTNAEFGSGSVAADGSFSFNLSEPSSLVLAPIDELTDTECQDNVTISDPNAKIAMGLVYVESDSGFVGLVLRGKIADENFDSVGDFQSLLIYVDRDLNVSGSQVCSYDGYTETSNYSLTLKKGWNMMVIKIDELTDSTEKILYSMSEPEGGKWMLVTFAGMESPAIKMLPKLLRAE